MLKPRVRKKLERNLRALIRVFISFFSRKIKSRNSLEKEQAGLRQQSCKNLKVGNDLSIPDFPYLFIFCVQNQDVSLEIYWITLKGVSMMICCQTRSTHVQPLLALLDKSEEASARYYLADVGKQSTWTTLLPIALGKIADDIAEETTVTVLWIS